MGSRKEVSQRRRVKEKGREGAAGEIWRALGLQPTVSRGQRWRVSCGLSLMSPGTRTGKLAAWDHSEPGSGSCQPRGRHRG